MVSLGVWSKCLGEMSGLVRVSGPVKAPSRAKAFGQIGNVKSCCGMIGLNTSVKKHFFITFSTRPLNLTSAEKTE